MQKKYIIIVPLHATFNSVLNNAAVKITVCRNVFAVKRERASVTTAVTWTFAREFSSA